MISVLRLVAQDESLLGSLDRLLERGSLREQTHGVALGFDVSWLSWISIFSMDRYRYFPERWPGSSGEDWLFFDGQSGEQMILGCLRKGPRPDWWSRHCVMQGYQEYSVPIIIKIIVRDPHFSPREAELPTTLESQFGTHPVVYQYRPACVAISTATSTISLKPSASIGQLVPQKTGTLGGFLKNTFTNQHYAVTCAHVLPALGSDVVYPGPSRSAHPTIVGKVDFCQLPGPTPGSQLCNNRSTFTNNQLDLALASIDLAKASPLPQVGYPSAVLLINQMSTGHKVRFYGQTSKSVMAKVDDLNIWRVVTIDGQEHCFGDIFSIVGRNRAYFNQALAKPGDSGSWVISDGSQPPAWAGMVIADDGLKAYCCFAEHIMDRVALHFGGSGSCVLP